MIVEVPDITNIDTGWIAITAAEGGINYWARTAKGGTQYDYTRWQPDGSDPIEIPDDFVFYTIEYENPNAEGTLKDDITPEVIRRGFAGVLSGKVRKDLVEQAWTSITEPGEEPGGTDAEVADCVVQIGIFGEVVFG